MDPFNEKNDGMSTPGFVPGQSDGLDYSNYRHRIAYFQLGGGSTDVEDGTRGLENLLTRGLPGADNPIIILERKTSISATTGIYTCVVNYLEEEPDA